MPQTILVVDDDAAACYALEEALRVHGHTVLSANGAAAALRHVKKATPSLVITDVRMPGGSGLDLLAELKRDHPALPVVVTTAYGSVETAATAIARGAFDFLPKPLDLDRALAVVERALGRRAVALEVAPGQVGEPVLVGNAPVMQEVFRRIALAAASDLPVLITGPTGSGKELAARLVHRHSAHAVGPFVAVNCGALPEAFAESELFGVAVGAVGGAAGSQGLFASAHGGTLLLDEVDALPAAVQSKLLRVLEDHQVRAVGADAARPMRVRVIASTCRFLGETQGFRADLAHRLTVMTLALPALADHPGDLPLITAHLLARLATRLGRPLSLTETALDRLVTHPWPGNVRELKHVLEEAAAVAPGGTIDTEHLRLASSDEAPPAAGADLRLRAEVVLDQAPGAAHARWLDAMEAPLFAAALARTRGNQLRAAELLGIHRTTLRKRSQELGLTAGKNEDVGEG